VLIELDSTTTGADEARLENDSAAKAGIMHGFTMATARDGARKGVTVKTVSPGYITGADFSVNGGHHIG